MHGRRPLVHLRVQQQGRVILGRRSTIGTMILVGGEIQVAGIGIEKVGEVLIGLRGPETL